MNNLAALLRIEFLKFTSGFAGKKSKKTATFLLLIFLIALTGIALSAFYSWLIIGSFISAGQSPLPATAVFTGAATMLVLVSSISQVRGIYIGEDYDLLCSLPIRKKDIVGAKVISLYLFELFFSLLIMLPHGVMMAILAKDGILVATIALLAVATPIVPIAVATILSLLTTMASARFRHANIVITIIYAALIAGISISASLTRNLSPEQIAQGFNSAGEIIKWINPTFVFVELAISSSWLFLLLYLGINLALLVGTVLLLALCFDKLHSIVASVSMKKKAKLGKLKNKNETRALLSMEMKRLMATRVYFINAMMGAIMGIAGSTIYLISLNTSMARASAEAIPYMQLLYIPIFAAIVMLIFGLAPPTLSAISIEGKNFWIAKTLPIDYRKYMNAKLLFTIILYGPASLIASTIAVIFYHNSVFEIIITYLLPLSYVLLTTIMGLLINLHHPKLRWSSETEVTKNSAAILIGMLINFGIILVATGLLIGLPLIMGSATLAYSLVLGGVLIAAIICYLILRKTFPKRIDAIEDF